MNHFLITRFNVPVANWNKDKAGITTLDRGWMEHRITLFNTFCVPSIAGQTEKDFKWLIYFDSATDNQYVQRIKQSINLIPQAELRFVNDFDALKKDLIQLISTDNAPFVITSRLDNDDALGNTYIQTVQANFIPEDQTVLNLCGGVLYDLPGKIVTMLPDMRFNHFGSLIEKRKSTADYLTVMGYAHHSPPSGIKVKDIKSQFAWLKIIHDRNVNSRTIGVPAFSRNIAHHFNLDKNVMPVSLINSANYFFNRGWAVLKKKIRP